MQCDGAKTRSSVTEPGFRNTPYDFLSKYIVVMLACGLSGVDMIVTS